MVNNRNKAIELFNSWQALTKLHAKQGKLILDLVGHPECTAEYIAKIMPVLSNFQATRESLRKHRLVVTAALQKHQLHRQAWQVEEWTP